MMLLMYFMILKLCESRHLNICEELNPRNFKEYENNVVCFNSTDSTIYNVTILPNSKVYHYYLNPIWDGVENIRFVPGGLAPPPSKHPKSL